MDDESAEIELLEQNLSKTRQISTRMISILDSFDARLGKLEKSILPLYTSAQMLSRRTKNIDKTLLKIQDVASNNEGIAVEEALIMRGPQSGQLSMYKEALERLNANIAFKGGEHDISEEARLVEIGAKKMSQLYTKMVAEGSSGTSPTITNELPSNAFPASLLATLMPMVTFLRSFPLPTTHPSHPAAKAILLILTDTQSGFADMRGNWAAKCLDGQGKRLVARADGEDPIATGLEFGEWVEQMMAVADDEYNLLQKLAPLTSPALIATTYGTFLKPILKLFSTVLNSLIALTKKSLHKHSYIALSAYDCLSQLQPNWDVMISRRDPTHKDETNELKGGLQALRGLCLRSFPEFLADLKMGSMAKGPSTSVKVVDFAQSTVKYLSRIPEVQSAVISALITLGDGNWKMGEGVQVGKGQKLGESDGVTVLEHFVYDVVTTVIQSLTIMSRMSRHPTFSTIFLMNNISYIRLHLLVQPKYPELPDLLSQAARDSLNSNYRTAKAAYFDTNFSPLMQVITDDLKEKTGKSAAKDKFTRFYDVLEEITERHKMAKVLEEDPEGRVAMADEVVMLVVPSLQRFTQKQKDKEFSKNPQKYIKMSADDVEKQLRGIFT